MTRGEAEGGWSSVDSRRAAISFNGFKLGFRTIKAERERERRRLRVESMRSRASASPRIQRLHEEMTGLQRDFLNDSVKPSRKNRKINVFKSPLRP